MKIKNSVNAFSPDISVLLMCFGILIACPLRIYQMLKNMDAVTGFYEDYGNITIIILYALLAVLSICILVFSYLSSRIPAAVAPKGRRIPLGIASFLFAASLFYDAVANFMPNSEATATIVQNAKTVSTLNMLQAVFAFLSCCYFLVFFISYITGNSFHKKLKILALAPLAWSIIRVLGRLTVIISFLRVSELLLELCALVFLMVFFLTFARVVSDVNCKGSMWSVISCGIVASMFILTYSIPRLMLMITGNSSALIEGYPFNFADAGSVLFILVFIITTLRCGYKVEDIEEMKTEIAEAQIAEDEVTEEEIPLSDSPVIDKSVDVKIAKTKASQEPEEMLSQESEENPSQELSQESEENPSDETNTEI